MNKTFRRSPVVHLLRALVRSTRREWHRACLRADGLEIGAGVIIEQDKGCTFTAGSGCSIGTGSLLVLRSNNAVSNHIKLGERVAINEYNNLRAAGGDIHIGSHCQIAQFCTLVAGNHIVETIQYIRDAPLDRSKGSICIEEDVWIGANCVILPGVTVGRGAVIGAGSIVTKDIPAYSIHVGNPSRLLRLRTIHA